MTDDVAQFRDNVRKVFEREFAPLEERWREQHLADRAVWRQAGETGLLCTSIPEAYGGAGGTFAHEAVVAYEQARALVNSFSINVHSGIVAHYLLAYGSEEQKLRWLPKMATRRAGRRDRDERARRRHRPAGRAHDARLDANGERLRDQRREDLHHQRPPCRPGVRRREDRRDATARRACRC